MKRRQGQQAYKKVRKPEGLQETDKYYLLQGLALILWSRIEVKANLSLSKQNIPMHGEEGGKSKFNAIQKDLDYRGEKKNMPLSHYPHGMHCVLNPPGLGTTLASFLTQDSGNLVSINMCPPHPRNKNFTGILY